MNAFEKAMAAIAKVIARGKPKTSLIRKPNPPRKPAKARGAVVVAKSRNRKHLISPRVPQPRKTTGQSPAPVVVAKPRDDQPPFEPPRTEPDVSALVEAFAPGPLIAADAPLRPNVNFTGLTPIAGGGTPIEPASSSPMENSSTTGGSFNVTPTEPLPWVDGRATERPGRPASVKAPPTPGLAPPASTTARTARGSCKAVDAATGRQCRLPAHQGELHRHERGPFHRLLQPGQVPTLRQALDEASLAACNAEVYAGASHVKGERLPTTKRSDGGELTRTIAKVKRNRAHAGEVTTGDHPSHVHQGTELSAAAVRDVCEELLMTDLRGVPTSAPIEPGRLCIHKVRVGFCSTPPCVARLTKPEGAA